MQTIVLETLNVNLLFDRMTTVGMCETDPAGDGWYFICDRLKNVVGQHNRSDLSD